MTQLLSIALVALKSINEVFLGGNEMENAHLTKARLQYYTYVLYNRI